MSEVPCALNNKNNENIGTPILISKPNPIIISDLKPTKGKVDEVKILEKSWKIQ